MADVIEIAGLRKTYRRRRGTTVAVAGLELAVPEGGVFGFLGPNGSGKSTTIRCLLGLARPTSGELRLLGKPVPHGLADTMRRTGAMVEVPALFPTMSGRENLQLLAAVDRIGSTRVSQCLERVGLGERADDLVKKYSLGMRQRLALAGAILKEPELLILDEPANGLDPAGMREVRNLLRGLAAEGRTVFVSSHILSEIEQTCDRVAIISGGKCVTTGTVDEVMSAAGHRSSVVVRVEDLLGAELVLREVGLAVEVVEDTLRIAVDPQRTEQVSRTLGEAGHWVTELRVDRFSLEDLFLELTTSPKAPASNEHDHVGVLT